MTLWDVSSKGHILFFVQSLGFGTLGSRTVQSLRKYIQIGCGGKGNDLMYSGEEDLALLNRSELFIFGISGSRGTHIADSPISFDCAEYFRNQFMSKLSLLKSVLLTITNRAPSNPRLLYFPATTSNFPTFIPSSRTPVNYIQYEGMRTQT